MPNAIVDAFSQARDSVARSSQARTIGAQPVAWTATSRGIVAPSQPMAWHSSRALKMPMSPTPPPVG